MTKMTTLIGGMIHPPRRMYSPSRGGMRDTRRVSSCGQFRMTSHTAKSEIFGIPEMSRWRSWGARRAIRAMPEIQSVK